MLKSSHYLIVHQKDIFSSKFRKESGIWQTESLSRTGVKIEIMDYIRTVCASLYAFRKKKKEKQRGA